MNYLQRMWIKAYQDYLNAAKANAEVRNKPLPTTDVFMARKHADAVLASLTELGD